MRTYVAKSDDEAKGLHERTITEIAIEIRMGACSLHSGDRIAVKEAMYLSDCGKYFARRVYNGVDSLEFDVLARDTGVTWFGRRYIPKGFDDTDRRHTHPEFSRMVTGWSNCHTTKHPDAFELGFADCDMNVRIKPLKGNTVIKSYSAAFHKRWPARMMPDGMESLHLLCESLVARQIDSPAWFWVCRVKKELSE